MAIFVVMEPPGTSRNDAASGAVLVRDAFSFLGFLLPPLWLLWHRLWIEAALVFALGVGVAALGEIAGLGFAGAALSLLAPIYVGLEGAGLRVNALRRRGWREWGVIEASDKAEAEIRYAAEVGADENVAPEVPHSTGPVQMMGRPAPSGPALGLFGYPGRP
jgi:hypothetical protein